MRSLPLQGADGDVRYPRQGGLHHASAFEASEATYSGSRTNTHIKHAHVQSFLMPERSPPSWLDRAFVLVNIDVRVKLMLKH
jgi:hypothetical protein